MNHPLRPVALSSRKLPHLAAGLEELCVEGPAGVAAGLAFLLAARDRSEKTWVLAAPKTWLRTHGRPLSASLAGFGPDPSGLLLAATRTETEALWVLEEALRSGAIGLAVGMVEAASLLATRRLDWAARAAGASTVLLKTRPARDLSAARRRWRVWPHPSAPHPWDAKASGAPRWHARLERSRDGSSGDWILEHDPQTHRLRMVEGLAGHGMELGAAPARRSA